MTEASSPSTNEKAQPEAERLIAVGALKRVFARRQKAKGRSRLSKEATTETDEDASEDGEGCEDEDRTVSRAVMNRTSNHFTLNVPGATRSQSDTPYILLGYVLQIIRSRSWTHQCMQLSPIFLQPRPRYGLPISAHTVHLDCSTRCGAPSL